MMIGSLLTRPWLDNRYGRNPAAVLDKIVLKAPDYTSTKKMVLLLMDLEIRTIKTSDKLPTCLHSIGLEKLALSSNALSSSH